MGFEPKIPLGEGAVRDKLHLPVCPGALHLNQCLWTYARTPTPRKSLTESPAIFEAHRQFFGRTVEDQNNRLNLDKHAYYALLDTDSVLFPVTMSPLFVGDSYKHDYTTWMETVTLL